MANKSPVHAIDPFIAAIEAGDKAEITACHAYCVEQSKDQRLQMLYRAAYKSLIPIFKAKKDDFK